MAKRDLIRALCGLAVLASGCGGPWPAKTRQDLHVIETEIELNHPGPTLEGDAGRAFRDRLSQAGREARALARSVRSPEGLAFVLAQFVNSIGDPALRLEPRNTKTIPRWPGFAVRKLPDGWRVEAVGALESGEPSPVLGAELVSCDGQKPDVWLEQSILPYWGARGSAADAWWLSPRVLLDMRNPFLKLPRRCVFRGGDGALEIQLGWRPAPASEIADRLVLPGSWPVRSWSSRRFGHGSKGFWVTLPSFRGSAQSKGVVETLSELRRNLPRTERLVVDLRGNTGGDSLLPRRLAVELLGDTAIAKAERELGLGPDTELWRSSSANVLELRRQEERMEKAGVGLIAGAYRKMAGILEKAREQGVPLTPIAPAMPDLPGGPPPRFPRLKHVFVLVDGACRASCLAFAELVLRHPKAVLAGQPTGPSSPFGEARQVGLPSGFAVLEVPMRYRAGGSGTRTPALQWTGDIRSTSRLEDWLASVTPAAPRP